MYPSLCCISQRCTRNKGLVSASYEMPLDPLKCWLTRQDLQISDWTPIYWKILDPLHQQSTIWEIGPIGWAIWHCIFPVQYVAWHSWVFLYCSKWGLSLPPLLRGLWMVSSKSGVRRRCEASEDTKLEESLAITLVQSSHLTEDPGLQEMKG